MLCAGYRPVPRTKMIPTVPERVGAGGRQHGGAQPRRQRRAGAQPRGQRRQQAPARAARRALVCVRHARRHDAARAYCGAESVRETVIVINVVISTTNNIHQFLV